VFRKVVSMPLWRMILTAVNLVGVRFGGAGIGLVSQILLARLLPQADVGIVFLGMSAAAVLSLIVTVGYPPLAMTWLPRYYALGRTNLVHAFHAAFWRDWFWVSLASAAVVAIAWYATPIDPGLKTALVFGLLSAPASSLIRINSATANSLRRFSLSYVPDFIYRPGLLLLYLGTSWFFHWPLTVERVLWAFVIGNTIIALAQAWIIGAKGAIPPPFRTVRHNLAPVLRSRAAALIIVAAVSASFADLVNIIGGLFLKPDDVAVLGVCIRLAALVGFITQATQNFILPDLAHALIKGKPGEVRGLLLRINVIAMVAIGACIMGAIVAGPFALKVFGPQYVAGHWPLVIFMVSQGLRAASGMNQHLLSIKGYQARTATACVFALATLVAAAALLCPLYGVLGMAMAVVMSDVVWAALLAHQAQKFTGRRGDLLGLLRAPA